MCGQVNISMVRIGGLLDQYRSSIICINGQKSRKCLKSLILLKRIFPTNSSEYYLRIKLLIEKMNSVVKNQIEEGRHDKCEEILNKCLD